MIVVFDGLKARIKEKELKQSSLQELRAQFQKNGADTVDEFY